MEINVDGSKTSGTFGGPISGLESQGAGDSLQSIERQGLTDFLTIILLQGNLLVKLTRELYRMGMK